MYVELGLCIAFPRPAKESRLSLQLERLESKHLKMVRLEKALEQKDLWDNIHYVAWVQIITSAIKGLEFYNPD